MKKLVLHIPHSSIEIPSIEGYIAEEQKIKNEILKLTDWYTNDLFYSETDDIVKADFSRIFCDVERFPDDKDEVMSQYGMGVLYEKNDEGELMRSVSYEYKKSVMNDFYWPHHYRLCRAVNNQLEQFGKALILDCHSYPSTPLKRDLNKKPLRPDFNIGTDNFHTPQQLIDVAVDFFDNAGFTLGVDWPYSGSIVPMEHYQKSKEVQTIMLEVNRALYLNEPTNEKSSNYQDIKRVISEFIKTIKNSL